MKYILIAFIVLLHLPVSGQPNDPSVRKSEIEKFTGVIYFITDFHRVVDSLQLSVTELSDYPVILPIRNPIVSSGFGMRKHPVSKRRQMHTGIDFVKARGTPVYATGNGVVSRTGYDPGYGNFIEIKHAGDFRSFYAHLSKTMVEPGDSVSIARQIACMGNTGVATGSHLHYEVRKGKRFLNPIGWCYCLSAILKNEFINEKRA